MAPSRHVEQVMVNPTALPGPMSTARLPFGKLIEVLHSLKPIGSVLGLLPPYPLVALAGDWQESTRVALSLDGTGCQAGRVDLTQERRGRRWRGEFAVKWHHSWSCGRCARCISNTDEPGSSWLRCLCTSTPRPCVPMVRCALVPTQRAGQAQELMVPCAKQWLEHELTC